VYARLIEISALLPSLVFVGFLAVAVAIAVDNPPPRSGKALGITIALLAAGAACAVVIFLLVGASKLRLPRALRWTGRRPFKVSRVDTPAS
jgi:hypothetical protein